MKDYIATCPWGFNGGQVSVFQAGFDDLEFAPNLVWFVGCSLCMCRGPMGGVGESGRVLAISRWNKRSVGNGNQKTE